MKIGIVHVRRPSLLDAHDAFIIDIVEIVNALRGIATRGAYHYDMVWSILYGTAMRSEHGGWQKRAFYVNAFRTAWRAGELERDPVGRWPEARRRALAYQFGQLIDGILNVLTFGTINVCAELHLPSALGFD